MTDEPPMNGGNVECPFCRAENPPGTDSCSECGRPVREDQWMDGTLVDSDTIDSQAKSSPEELVEEVLGEASVLESMEDTDTGDLDFSGVEAQFQA